jgi:peptide/nickel transport system permease protein
VPIFWLGLMALVLFYAKLGWVAGPGRIDVTYEYTLDAGDRPAAAGHRAGRRVGGLRNALSHLVLPAALLGYFSLAYISRMTRSSCSTSWPGVRRRGARQGPERGPHHLAPRAAQRAGAAGHGGRAVLRRLLEGSVLTETVFAWPGWACTSPTRCRTPT